MNRYERTYADWRDLGTPPFSLVPARYDGLYRVTDSQERYFGYIGFNGNAKQRRQQKRQLLRFLNET